MMRTRHVFAILVVLVALPLAGAKRPVTTNVPAAVEFRCPSGADCLLDRIAGDFLGAYGGDASRYFFNGNGDLQMYVTSPRSIYLDFAEADGPAPCLASGCRKDFTAITTTSPSPGIAINPTDENDVELANGFESIPVGGSAYARVKINFPDPSGRAYLWTVRFNSGMYAGSTNPVVTRVATNVWVVEATAADRARLVATTTSRKAITTDEGLYVMPFRVTITK